MTSRLIETSPRRAAQIAGIGYLVIFVLAIFANFIVVTGLIEPGDAAATAANITESEGLFRLGVVAFTVVFAIDVVIAWALYVVFRDSQRDLSLLAAWLRLTYTVLLGVAVVFLFVVLELLSGAGYLAAFDSGQLDAQALLALEAFDYAWLVGLVCFGAHLIMLGYLVLRSGYVSRILGYLLIVAGTAYAADTFARAVLSNYADFEDVFVAVVAVPSVIGELWLGLWLLFKGGKRAAPAA